MSATTIKSRNELQQLKGVLKTNYEGILIIENENSPQAGTGACKVCSCQKFVKPARFQMNAPTSAQPMPCDNCGHDIRVHG